MNQLQTNNEQSYFTENQFKAWIAEAFKNVETHQPTKKEWMSIKEACVYIGVAYNTFAKYREMGLRVCEIDGVKRVSKSEIDSFLNRFSY
ncbi:hypothetical protein BTO30_00610 [Domibacillus antri]|uniref:Helix-turn-helix domain-containing protein n=1 Tax=Domibacillus antri TaxID=1714264 RepID=A0A1Q8Q9J6_9BACI|nr:helix-turn-helix domain-containing protein [Domibacillus antri]OLN23962.1 hypothetical protein BTO30_00610 [Domibacillus antri]